MERIINFHELYLKLYFLFLRYLRESKFYRRYVWQFDYVLLTWLGVRGGKIGSSYEIATTYTEIIPRNFPMLDTVYLRDIKNAISSWFQPRLIAPVVPLIFNRLNNHSTKPYCLKSETQANICT